MIAFAIASLLVVTAILALLSLTDSIMRGWHSYGALRSELRALRATMNGAGPSCGMNSRPARVRPVRRPARHAPPRTTALRAAA